MNVELEPTTLELARVRRWMEYVKEVYRDGKTGEVNCTKLAEDAAEAGELYLNDTDFDIPEWVFELASVIGREE